MEKYLTQWKEKLVKVEEAGKEESDLIILNQIFSFCKERYAKRLHTWGFAYWDYILEATNFLVNLKLDEMTLSLMLLSELENLKLEELPLSKSENEKLYKLWQYYSKLKQIQYNPKLQDNEIFTQLMINMSVDVRVLLVRFAHQLQIMKMLDYASDKEKVLKYAQETQEIYVPLSERCGMGRLRSDYEDLAFKYLHPKEYKRIEKLLEERLSKLDANYLDNIKAILLSSMQEVGIEGLILSRIKRVASIYNKMKRLGLQFEEVPDLLAVRVLLNERGECYHLLQLIHNHWMPLPHRYRDHLANPKKNGYQSLHTTVDDNEQNMMIEFQIRTFDMHSIAEQGIAAHWRYKQGDDKGQGKSIFKMSDKELKSKGSLREWVENFLNQSTMAESSIKKEIGSERIYVLTPNLEIKKLPKGATPLDFAFAIHSEIGERFRGANVNGHIVPIDYKLKDGDIVDIITSPKAQPKEHWLNIVKSSKAKSKIKHALHQQKYQEYIVSGRSLVEFEARKRHISQQDLKKIMKDAKEYFEYRDIEALYAAVGLKHLHINRITKYLDDILKETEEEEFEEHTDKENIELLQKSALGVSFGDIDNIEKRYAACCNPIPGDKIVGYITRGRGITVHWKGCKSLKRLNDAKARTIPLNWNQKKGQMFITPIIIIGERSKALVSDVTRWIASMEDTTIRTVQVSSKADETTVTVFLEVQNTEHLGEIISRLKIHLKKVKYIGRKRF